MHILFHNITRITGADSLFNQLWVTSTSALYISSTYALCLLAICFCMYCNTYTNLIYKVLNLAVLSVFVVAVWSYLTDVTFIYVVYILTFVSAVVMLFLSVVLMLPSSAVAAPRKAAINFVLLTSISSPKFVFDTLFLILAIVGVYLLYGLYLRSKIPNSSESRKYQGSILDLLKKELLQNGDPYSQMLLLEHIQNNYEVEHLNTAQGALRHLDFHNAACIDFSTNGATTEVLGDAKTEILYLGLKPHTLTSSGLLQIYYKKYLLVFYEFLDFFLAVLDNFGMRFNHKFPNMYKFVNRQLIEGQTPFISSYKRGRSGVICIRLFNNNTEQSKIFLYINRPWWSPFIIFHATYWTSIFVGLQSRLSDITVSFFYALSKYSWKIQVNFLLSSFINLFSSRQLEILAQLFASISIFLLAIPAGYFNTTARVYSSMSTSSISDNSFENLAAIQHELYIGSPLLLLVCVVGLLVALVGAALLVSTKVLNSR